MHNYIIRDIIYVYIYIYIFNISRLKDQWDWYSVYENVNNFKFVFRHLLIQTSMKCIITHSFKWMNCLGSSCSLTRACTSRNSNNRNLKYDLKRHESRSLTRYKCITWHNLLSIWLTDKRKSLNSIQDKKCCD